MSYRADLDAALARADALEQESETSANAAGGGTAFAIACILAATVLLIGGLIARQLSIAVAFALIVFAGRRAAVATRVARRPFSLACA